MVQNIAPVVPASIFYIVFVLLEQRGGCNDIKDIE